MAEGGFDDLEMKERRYKYPEDEDDDEDEDESEEDESEEDESEEDESEEEKETSFIKGDIPNVIKDVGFIKRSMPQERKNFFKRYQKTEIRARDGPASKELLDKTKFLFDKRDRIRGLSFDGTEVLVGTEERGFSESRRSKKKVLVYRKLLNEARNEHKRSLTGLVETISNTPTPTVVVKDIVTQTIEKISETVETQTNTLESESRGVNLTEQEIREFVGALKPKGTNEVKIEALETHANDFRLRALRETDPSKESFYKSVSETAELKADSIRLKLGQRPEHEEANPF